MAYQVRIKRIIENSSPDHGTQKKVQTTSSQSNSCRVNFECEQAPGSGYNQSSPQKPKFYIKPARMTWLEEIQWQQTPGILQILCNFLFRGSQDFFLSSCACCMIPRPTITPSANTSAALRFSFVMAWTWRRYSCSTRLACARWMHVSTKIGRMKRRKNLFAVVKALEIVKILSDTTLRVVCTSITLQRVGRVFSRELHDLHTFWKSCQWGKHRGRPKSRFEIVAG